MSRGIFLRLSSLGAALVILSSCAPTSWDQPARDLAPGKVDSATSTQPLENGSLRTWKADFDRLATEMRRAFRDMAWGTQHVRTEPSGSAIQAMALLADGRTATVQAGSVAANQITVAVRVGLTGDVQLQAQFLDVLAKRLAGEAARVHGGTFELP